MATSGLGASTSPKMPGIATAAFLKEIYPLLLLLLFLLISLFSERKALHNHGLCFRRSRYVAAEISLTRARRSSTVDVVVAVGVVVVDRQRATKNAATTHHHHFYD